MNETNHEAGVRLVQLRAKLKSREGRPEFKSNVAEINAEIARLEAITASPAVASKED